MLERTVIIPVDVDGYMYQAGSARIRCHWLAKAMGADVYVGQCLDDYDVIIYQKCCLNPVIKALAELYKDKMQIFDLCDPEYYFAPDHVKYMVDRCKILIASSPSLATDFSKWAKRDVWVIPDSVDLDFFKVRKVHEDVHPKLVWFGYCDNFSIVRGHLQSIERLGLDLIVIGDYPVQYGKYHKWDVNTICENIITGDIVFNPRGTLKSNNKTLWGWALGMPVAENIEDIKRFMTCESRIEESEWRLEEVKTKWSSKKIAEDLIQLIMAHDAKEIVK